MDLKVCIFLVANILCVSKYVLYIYMHRIYIYAYGHTNKKVSDEGIYVTKMQQVSE